MGKKDDLRLGCCLGLAGMLLLLGMLGESECYPHGTGAHSGKQGVMIPDRLVAGYKAQIEPIFRAKCFDCHSRFTSFPWYHRLPAVRQLLDKDIAEGREHMDMSDGFPFRGHGDPAGDLKAIVRVVEENSMPPLRYKLLHWRSGLTEGEKRVVFDWAKDGLASLNNR